MGLEPLSSPEGAVPSGGIIMWSGDGDNIPDGWTLCDGADASSNLTNRFVIGACDNYSSGSTGGNNSQSVSGNTNSGGGHDHSGATDETSSGDGSGHQHGYEGQWSGNKRSTNSAGGAETHTHGIDSDGNHDHYFSDSIDNRPSYYALAYIMKL